MSDEAHAQPLGAVAVVGLSCRFPGAANAQEYWRNLCDGIESIRPVDEMEKAEEGWVDAHGALEGIDRFDAAFFGLTPREAQATDPQQRIFLECAWQAMEHAGFDPSSLQESVGVFAGTGSSYYLDLLRRDPKLLESVGGMQLIVGNGKDHVAPRASYLFDLRGPSVPVQTACSTSLVATHLACQSLIHFECDVALAGGVSIAARPSGYRFQTGDILSPDGHCRPFDEQAQGTVPGSGAGVVVLKRLEDALECDDCIYAIILGSAINNDGASKVGYTAPSVEGQRRVIEEALEVSGIDPSQISFVEAHGTATELGDPIEVEALKQAWSGAKSQPRACALGSVKGNIGHLDAAAGVAGLIKTVLCLHHRKLVPSLNFRAPNPQIDFEQTPFRVNTEARDWDDGSLVGAVSSFGIGGTNAHMILQQGPARQASQASSRCQALNLSAKSMSALEQARSDLRDFISQHPETPLEDIAFTLNTGRKSFEFRQTIVCRDRDEACLGLESTRDAVSNLPSGAKRRVVFMFSGQGTGHCDWGGELYRNEPAFRREADRCSAILKPLLGLDLSQAMFAQDSPQDEDSLRQPRLWQPALFVQEWSLAKLWMSWGVEPDALIGHSIGEYAAAALAGVLKLDDALRLVATRGKGTQALPGGAMLAVVLSESEAQPYLSESISLAAVNGPQLCVLSGPESAVDLLESTLKSQGHQTIRLEVSHAFHSPMIEPLMEPLKSMAAGFRLQSPKIPLISGVSGTWMTESQSSDPQYWADHLRRPVRFHEGLEELSRETDRVYLEVGPGRTLARLAQRRPEPLPAAASLAEVAESEAKAEPVAAARSMAAALGELWKLGAAVDWKAFYQHERRNRVALPTYAFQRSSYWVGEGAELPDDGLEPDPLDRKDPIRDWLYLPSWRQTPPPPGFDSLGESGKSWLVFEDSQGLCTALVRKLQELEQPVMTVRAADVFAADGASRFELDPRSPADFDRLMGEVLAAGPMPAYMVYGWGLESEAEKGREVPERIDRSLGGLLRFVQALDSHGVEGPVQVGILASESQQVAGEAELNPVAAALEGAVHVIPKEIASLKCRFLDIDPQQSNDCMEFPFELLGDLCWAEGEDIVAYRFGRRWTLGPERVQEASGAHSRSSLAGGGCLLLVNGLTETGLRIAESLSRIDGIKLALLDRGFFPPREEWADWIREQGETEDISLRIRRLEKLPCPIRIISSDPSDRSSLQSVRSCLTEEMGPIRGVFLFQPPFETGLIQGKAAAAFSERIASRAGIALSVSDCFGAADFVVFFAENPAESGGIGQLEPACSYAFLDGLARSREKHGSSVLKSIDWSTFQWSDADSNGSALASPISVQLAEKRRRFGMTAEEGVAVLERVLGLGRPQAIVSTRSYRDLLAQQRLFTSDFFQQQLQDGPGQTHSRPELPVPYAPPSNEVEELISEAWESFFGINGIGIHDNFFELGGHSLLAVQLLSRLNALFSSQLTLQQLFEHPTIAEMASVVSQEQLDPDEAEALNELLEEIEGLSEMEVHSALAVEGEVR